MTAAKVTALIGVDCATQANRTGVAYAEFTDSGTQLTEADLGGPDLLERLSDWLQRGPRTLLALDAPLGWPEGLGAELSKHRAGQIIDRNASELFHRHTDREIQRRIRKRPLEVGADRIARTAHAALQLLGNLRDRTGCEIPLAWSPCFSDRIAAIEVYPAATLGAHAISSSSYRKDEQVRHLILTALRQRMTIEVTESAIIKRVDVLDAAICVLAGIDFLAHRTVEPENRELAEREGWIWAAE